MSKYKNLIKKLIVNNIFYKINKYLKYLYNFVYKLLLFIRINITFNTRIIICNKITSTKDV